MAGDAEKVVKAIDKVGQERHNKDKKAREDMLELRVTFAAIVLLLLVCGGSLCRMWRRI